MIIEFSIENYKSFKELQTLNLQTAKIKPPANIGLKRYHEVNKKLSILRTKAIFGANGSGKSNLIKAMAAFWKILEGNLQPEPILPLNVFCYKLDKKTLKQPTFFQIIILIDGIQYRYGFEADNNRIHSEWLYVKDKTERAYFVREHQEVISYNKNSFSEIKTVLANENTLYKENTLILSILNALNGSVSTVVFKGIVNAISINTGALNSRGFWNNYSALNFNKNKEFQTFSLDLLKSIDDTISGFEVMEHENGTYRMFTKRMSGRKELSFDMEAEEAEGTQKVFALSFSFYVALKNGFACIIDEFDSRLHPKLTRAIINLFHSIETHPEAQLIFVSHDTNLMDSSLLRRDQVTFVEKSKSGESEIYDLSDIQGVRENDLFERNYLKGKYGALPYLQIINSNIANG